MYETTNRRVPNRCAGRNKRAGGKILKTLNMQDRIDVQGKTFWINHNRTGGYEFKSVLLLLYLT